jgi:hypothetical protein
MPAVWTLLLTAIDLEEVLYAALLATVGCWLCMCSRREGLCQAAMLLAGCWCVSWLFMG